jgi:ABC-2 type transport system ATP-binding protein
MSELIIHVQNLSKSFKKVKKKNPLKDMFKPDFSKVEAVKNISFSIKKGESVAFLGPNGAGKTTTIKMLTGLIYPTTGEVTVLGFKSHERKKEYLSRIGLVMGNKAGLNWDLTPRQSFELLRQIYNIPHNTFEARLKTLTELLETKRFLDTQVRKLSLGERMKMELIGAILHDPEVLFLDEPMIGLDIISKQKIREFLREIQQKTNVTLLLTSHDMDDIEKVCDRVIVINKGEKVYDDSISNLTAKYNETRYVKFFFEKTPMAMSLDLKHGIEIAEKGENYYLYKTTSEMMPRLISEVTATFELVDIDIISVPLEEIIADLFKKSI